MTTRCFEMAAQVTLAASMVVAAPAFAGDRGSGGASGWTFVDVTAAAGIDHVHGYDSLERPIEPRWISAGVAAGDVDGDGWVDLFVAGGELGTDRLYRNLGDGTFEVAVDAGVAFPGRLASGPLFVDIDGDRHLDLLVPSVSGSPEVISDGVVEIAAAITRVYRNLGDGTFVDETATRGFDGYYDPTYALEVGDLDGDDDLDLILVHWRFPSPSVVWRNQGAGVFADDTDTMLVGDPLKLFQYAFAPVLVDVDADRHLDLLVAADFGNSQVLSNDGLGVLVPVTTSVIDDENGMGTDVGDVDGDGDVDWVVTSIWDPDGTPSGQNWGVSGNRLYTWNGAAFDNETETSGIREGYWGWGACLADLDHDGDLDLFHVNGFPAMQSPEFHADPSRLFVGVGDGTFVEQSSSRGLTSSGQGRGVACFDYDHDGDLDIAIAQNGDAFRLYRNDAPATHRSLIVDLAGTPPNTAGIGAKVTFHSGEQTWHRWVRPSGGFVGRGTAAVHVGLGDRTGVDRIETEWPNGERSTWIGVALDANRRLVVDQELIVRGGFETGGLDGW